MATFARKLLPLLTIGVLTACGGGGSGTGNTSSQNNDNAARYHVAGQVQKGPFIFGSQIWISELDDKLSPTGKVYMTQTKDDLGNFGIPGSVTAKLVELTGSGYYMNELSGTLSTAPVTLNGVADLSVSKSLTINLLTTLQAPRLKALMAGGSDYQSAYAQSRNEVLAVFGIDPAAVDNLGSLFDMRINGGSDQDAILLATSAILSQVARTQAPGTETAELSHLISSIAANLADHGKLSSSDLQAQLKTAAGQIDLDGVRRNVETYYANRGIALAAPRFEEWLDKDGSGVLPRRVIPVNGLVFNNVADAELRQIYSSNPVKVTGLPAGKNVAVSLTGSATLLKNHRPVSGRYTTAQNGDVFELQDRSLGFSQQVQSVLRVGSSNIGWQINSKQTGLELDTTYYPLSNSSNGSSKTIPANKLIAWKITPDHTFNAKYLGLDIQPDGKADDRTIHTADLTVGIYSDDAGKPGQQLLSSNNLTDLFDANTTVPSVNNGQKGSFLPASLQYLLGSSGISLQAGQTYWIVLAPPLNNKWGLSIKTMNGGTTSVAMYSTDGKNWSTCSGSMLSMYPGSSYCSSDYSSEFTPAIWLAR